MDFKTREYVNSGGALVNGAVLRDKPCVVHNIHVYHDGGAAAVIQIFDSATEPADGTVPLIVHAVQANNDADVENFAPVRFKNGLYVCESSTVPTKTLVVATHLFISAIVEHWRGDDTP